ncbi:hypothetical protein BD324DRAFT_183626 [Kockovaella imperatae]|uniref:Uncharacterized protein n=1 Tax=Kockovaella imperatae TaxID=4999 RepID=A0A1Y1U7D6_9TREE|nr:hypothetical protein BD324DRAFT_183626 [Kockovaella imperatae]ORX33939.1 hypothetical protein BD324DRAFT_183626 [Kockovaella imperatae]
MNRDQPTPTSKGMRGTRTAIRDASLRSKSVISQLERTDLDPRKQDVCTSTARQLAKSDHYYGTEEDHIARRHRALRESHVRVLGATYPHKTLTTAQSDKPSRSSCLDFSDALMSFNDCTRRPSGPPLAIPILWTVSRRPIDDQDDDSEAMPDHASRMSPRSAYQTPRKATSRIQGCSPPSPASSNLVTPPTPRVDLPFNPQISPTPTTPTRRSNKHRAHSSLSSQETVLSPRKDQAGHTPKAHRRPRLHPSAAAASDFDLDIFTLRLLSPVSPKVLPSFFKGSDSRPERVMDDWGDDEEQLVAEFPLPPSRDDSAGPGASRGCRAVSRPASPVVETPDTLKPRRGELMRMTQCSILEDLWWDDESETRTVTADTPRTVASFASESTHWSAVSKHWTYVMVAAKSLSAAIQIDELSGIRSWLIVIAFSCKCDQRRVSCKLVSY